MEVPTRIEVEGGERVVLTWEDGTTTTIGADTLRAACGCASCQEPQGAASVVRVLEGDEPIRITDVRLVGDYALAFTFAPDGHWAGIYAYDTLRELG